jgi:hypothetical protein
MRRLLSIQVILVLTFLLIPAGCGTDGFTLAPVSGKVVVDGEPVVGLRVAFEPVGGESRPVPGPESIAITDAEGHYSVATTDNGWRGAVVGPCRVRIWTVPSQQDEALFDDRNPNYDPIAEIKALKSQMRGSKKKVQKSRGLLPQRYNDKTELTFNVPPEGTDKADFNISWK